tara:strand:- start:260 stop:1135 length:876 start_codon:yes stop_codon:yes gene_type:complete
MSYKVSPTNLEKIYNFDNMSSSSNYILIGIIIAVVLIYVLIFSSIKTTQSMPNPLDASTSNSFGIMEMFILVVVLSLIAFQGAQYFFGLDVTASIKNIFKGTPEVDVNVETDKETRKKIVKKPPVPEIKNIDQVFHIPDNKYTYEDAKAVCAAYGSRLANYEEIEDAYKKSGEWCSYGWSKNQMALYPTQKKTYDKLQKIKGHEHDCGRPGVNGGYIANPNIRFGVNCFGNKPKITPLERDNMANISQYPITKEDVRFERKVQKYRNILPYVEVAPFNKNQWSESLFEKLI